MKKNLITINDEAEGRIFPMIIELCGDEIADALIDAAGGTRVSMPSTHGFNEDSELARLLGFARAQKVVEEIGTADGHVRFNVPSRTEYRIEQLLKQNGITAREVAIRTGVSMRTIHRKRAAMRRRGVALGSPAGARHMTKGACDNVKGVGIVRQLLLEGHAPSLLRDIMNIPPEVILTIRAELLKQGKLK
ncbi:MAG: hypothetical protein DI589_02075 [Shinella sp.]|nr:MAG: hypothetical protein DI589_02075 [Shinella sp.]